MSNIYIKAESEAAMMAALDTAGLVIDGIVQVCGKADVYVIGTMYDGDQPLPGYYANVRTTDAEIIAKLEPLSCVVASPSFVFA